MEKKWEDPSLISEELLDFLGSAAHVAANVEGPLVGKDAALMQAKEMRLMHTIDPAAVELLKKIGADIWCLCNNHIMDAGQEGLAASLKLAAECGVKTVGVGKDITEACRPVILDEAGGIGIFSAGYRRGCKPAGEDMGGCLCWNETERIQEIIKGIKSKCRWCVALIHGGEEFTSLPSPYVRQRYLAYLDMGADLVVCHHPHVPMNYERVGDKAIFYSLGNFIFDTPYQRAQFHTEEGILLKLHFTESEWRFEAMGLKIDREKEQIKKAGLPDIFCEVDEEEYEKLAPLSAKAFVSATKRQQIFLHPEKFTEASDEEWREHFLEEKRSGRVEGEALDFRILLPFSEEAEQGAWKESRLDKVKDYILKQI
ncbi:MAG: CapA family protein [Lachnospiraceae bacterium]|nr:CapA family protein [Lachnospiraceae bacterium]